MTRLDPLRTLWLVVGEAAVWRDAVLIPLLVVALQAVQNLILSCQTFA